MLPHLRLLRLTRLLTLGLVVLGLPLAAQAAPPWIYRGITLPRGEVALDVGFGLGHDTVGTGSGLNLELGVGVTHELELGFRFGFRFDNLGAATQADAFGRPFDTETYGTFGDRVADPELRMRWSVARGSSAQLGLELRAYLPIEDHSRFGIMPAIPIALRAGSVRIDTGLYVPIIFTDPTTTIVSIPVHVWIQASSSLWLGPLTGYRVVSSGSTHSEVPLGFGLGTMLRHNVDLKFWFLFRHINGDQAAREFGGGVGLEVRI